jgi:hypothetical protein
LSRSAGVPRTAERSIPEPAPEECTMSGREKIPAAYVAIWHEPDAEVRRKAIAELWAEDGVYFNSDTEFRGLKGVEDAVTEAYEAFIKNGYVFNVVYVDTNHDAVRYQWKMLPAAGGPPAAIGTHVFTVGADDRIVCDHQFIDQQVVEQA